jgi:signal transduction histidine kinase
VIRSLIATRSPRSLRARLTLAVAIVVLLAVALTFLVVYRTTGSQLRAQIDSSISNSARQLGLAVTEQPAAGPRRVLAIARRYAASQPYAGSSPLLFVIVPGVGTASNHPELFGAPGADTDDHESQAVQRQENAEGRSLTRHDVGFRLARIPDGRSIEIFEERLTVDGKTVFAGAGEDIGPVERAEHVVSHSFAMAGALALVLAVLAAYLIGSRITGPIRRSAAVASRVDGGDLTPRIVLPRGSSTEVEVLAEALNHMLDRLSAAFAAQREFVADASHELRTPLTVLRGQLELLGAAEQRDVAASPAELARVRRMMEAEIGRLSRLVDDLLLLAQSDREDFLHREPVRLDELATELWDGLSLIAERRFDLGALAPVTVEADPDQLAQALRNLARNAIAHTRTPDGLVRIEVTRPRAGTVRITVSDDGPGVDGALRERVFERFYRTDASRTRAHGGAGLGLAIVKAIVEAHEGSVRVLRAPGGGASFEIDLPDGSNAIGAPSPRGAPAQTPRSTTQTPRPGAREPEADLETAARQRLRSRRRSGTPRPQRP